MIQYTDTMSDTAKPLRHLGLILDGNRRWAKAKNLPTLEGHRHGLEVFKDISLEAFDRGVEFVSAYIFSTENWNRTQEEVSYLMGLVLKAVEKHLDTFHDAGIRLVHLGSREGLSDKVLAAIDRSIDKTKQNTKGTLALCFNYGGQQEVIDAANTAIKSGKLKLTPEDIEQNLYTPDVPALDLVIRTSGEQRLSGFMLWRSSYAEMLFVEKNWPDLTKEDLHNAIDWYDSRQRRFGE